MKVVITGGAGFIGSHAVNHFVDCGDDVLNLDSLTYAAKVSSIDRTKFVKLDIRETDKVHEVIRDFSPDVIINFAAETHVDNSIRDCSSFIDSNITGVASLLKVCKRLNTRLLHISTDEVYGPASSIPFTEDSPLNPMNPYSVTKAAADMMIKAWRNTYGIDYMIVRPSNNYGPRQNEEKLIPKFMKCLKDSSRLPLYGSGNQEREWTYVGDTVKIIRNILINNKIHWNNVYNISSGQSMNNLETLKNILESYNEFKGTNIKLDDVVQYSEDRPGHDKKYSISSSRISSFMKIDYTPFKVGIGNTLRETFEI